MQRILILLFFTVLTHFSFSQTWQTDFYEAKNIASEEGKKIVLVFSGSDWCRPCKKLEMDVWNTDEFSEYAKDHFVLVKADFPKGKKNKLSKEQQEKNNLLAEAYNQGGSFPLVVVFDSEGNILGKTDKPSKEGAKAYAIYLDSIK